MGDSVYSVAAMPLGSLLGDAFGATTVMYVGGVGFVWIVCYVAAIPSLRRLAAPTAVETFDYDGPRTTESDGSDTVVATDGGQ